MLAPPEREPSFENPEPLRRSLLESILLFGATGVGLGVYLWAFTHWFWLAVHHGLHSFA
jgi:hypothetical protein